MTIVKRFKSETPSFFKKMRLVGVVIGAAGVALLAPPVAALLPVAITSIAGYLVAAGSVCTAVSSAAVKGE